MNNELLIQAFEIFKPPFKYHAITQKIVDSEGNMILDVRGWGRVSKFENGERIQDAYGEYFANLINKDLNKSEYELVKKAEAEQAKADTKRIDFLADRNQMVANVMLPTEIVEQNVSSLRDAIDKAMMVEESENE